MKNEKISLCNLKSFKKDLCAALLFCMQDVSLVQLAINCFGVIVFFINLSFKLLFFNWLLMIGLGYNIFKKFPFTMMLLPPVYFHMRVLVGCMFVGLTMRCMTCCKRCWCKLSLSLSMLVPALVAALVIVGSSEVKCLIMDDLLVALTWAEWPHVTQDDAIIRRAVDLLCGMTTFSFVPFMTTGGICGGANESAPPI